MSQSIIFNTPILLILSVLALLALVAACFVYNKTICAVLSACGFIVVLGCITYALLLGATLQEILFYVLIYVVTGLTEFIPKKDQENERKPLPPASEHIPLTGRLNEVDEQSDNKAIRDNEQTEIETYAEPLFTPHEKRQK